MAIKKCPECGKDISDQSTICVNCGFPLNQKCAHRYKKRKTLTACIIITIIIVFTSVLVVFANSKSPNPVLSSAPPKNEVRESQVMIQQEAAPQEPINIKCNQTVSISEVCSFSVSGYDVTSMILPPNIASVYHYFEAPADNVFVDVKMQIKNLRTIRIAQDHVIDSVKILYDNDYEYFCNFVVELGNGNDLSEFTSIYGIEPLQTMQYHMLALLPISAQSDNKPLQAVISVNGEEYLCNLR